MLKTRWLAGLLAAVAGLGLVLGGSVTAEEKKAAGKDNPQPTAGSQEVDELATAYSLVNIGRKHTDPLDLITAAKVMVGVKDASDKDADKVNVEGAGDAKVPTKQEYLEGLIKEAMDMPTAKNNAHLKAIADNVLEQIATARGTPGGHTEATFGIDPGKPVTATKLFLGGHGGTAIIANVNNKAVPLYIEVYNPANKLVSADVRSGSARCDWVVPKDGKYTIKVYHKHTFQVVAKLTTN